MTAVESLEKTLEALHVRAESTSRNAEGIQNSIQLIEGFLSDYMKWGGGYGKSTHC